MTVAAGGLLSLALVCLASAAGKESPTPSARLHPADLRCEYLVDPLGIDVEKPRLSWIVVADPGERGQAQTAYQVRVASSAAGLTKKTADLWESGRVASADTLGIIYGGRLLKAGEQAFWSVRVWDRDGKASEYSKPASWETGLRPADWRAKWIRSPQPGPATEREMFGDDPAPLFRKEVTLSKPIRKARAHVTGLGYYELRLNGEKVGDHVLDPGWTSYDKRVYYSTYDVTRMLKAGKNAIGAMVGNGWWNPLPLRLFGRFNLRESLTIGRPRFILQLEVEYRDGTRETIVTDESWKTVDGPVLRNSVYLGEVYDARKELPGWDRAGFDDAAWTAAAPATEAVGKLEAQLCPPIRESARAFGSTRTEPKPGVFIFDVGANFAGLVKLSARGAAGTRIQLRYGELLYPDGTLNPMTAVCTQIKNSRTSTAIGGPATAWQSDTYILRGEGVETYMPRFTFRGFRYVEVTGYPGTPGPDAVSGRALHADLPEVGTFESSDETLTAIQKLCVPTFLSNVFSVQSDCPHREKLGYGGDIVATSDALMLNFDMSRFYAKTVQDFADAARPNGGITETAPFVGIADEGLGEGAGPVGWGTALPLLMWQLYQYYGDRRVLEEHYGAGARWVVLLRRSAKDGILDNGISDHESLVPKPRALTGTAFYYYNAHLMERIARVLGKRSDAAAYAKLADEIRAAFNARFLKPGTGRYDTATQCCQATALFMGLVPESEKQTALDVLTADIAAHGGHLTTGIFGTKYMLRALSELGRGDAASVMVHQRTFPSWGHMVDSGATTLWETWKASDNVYSNNHPMFGSVSEWLFRSVGGINPAEDAVGWNKIVLRPYVAVPVQVGYRSARGMIKSDVSRVQARIVWTIAIPANTTAEVHVPAALASIAPESVKANGVRLIRQDGGHAVFGMGSGEYRFSWALAKIAP